MNIKHNIETPIGEFDKTYLKERFKFPYLEDTFWINNYVDILSLIYAKLDSNKKQILNILIMNIHQKLNY